MSKKILHITTGLNDGGAEKTLFDLIKNSKNNLNIVISLRGKGKYGKYLEEYGIKVFYLNFSFSLYSIFKFFKLIQIIKKTNPDIVQTWQYHADFIGGFAAFIANSRNILWSIHHTSLDKKLNKKTTLWIIKLNSFFSYFIPKKIIFCAESAKESHLKYGFCKNKIKVIPNGVDFSKFKKSFGQRLKYRKRIGIASKETLFGTVARYDRNKDHLNLLRALVLLKASGFQFKYLLVGENIDYKNKELVSNIENLDLEDEVLLLGKEKNIEFVMNAIDLHILSSKSEAFPLVVLEAIACGTLCISTDVGDVRKIIRHKDFLIKPKNPKSLFEAILKFQKLSNQNINAIQNESLKRIKEKYSIKQMSIKYNKLYSKFFKVSKSKN